MPTTVDRVNAEIRTVIEDCLDSSEPMTQLARHSLRLLGDQSWNGEDAQEVVEAAKVMLESLAKPDY